MKVDATSRATAVGFHREREAIAAARATKHFVRRHQIGRLRPFVSAPAASRTFPARRLRRGRRPVALPRVILIATLAVLAIAHLIVCVTTKDGSSIRFSPLIELHQQRGIRASE